MDEQYIAGLYGLGGVVLGAIISSGFSYFIESRKIRTAIAEKVLTRRVDAYESILTLISNMVLMNLRDERTFSEDPERYPWWFSGAEEFREQYAQWTFTTQKALHWLDRRTMKEMNLYSDYLLNVSYYVNSGSESEVKELGVIVRQDIIDFVGSIGSLLRNFFHKEIYRARPARFGDWSKYRTKTSVKRLEATELFKNRTKLASIFSDGQITSPD